MRNSLTDQRDRTGVLSHLIDREHTIRNEIGFRRGELREDETGTIAEQDVGRKSNRLEVFCLSWRGGDGDLLLSDEGVDRRRFTDVGVSDESNDHLFRRMSKSDRN